MPTPDFRCRVSLEIDTFEESPNEIFVPRSPKDFKLWCNVRLTSLHSQPFDKNIYEAVRVFLNAAMHKNQSFAIHGDFFDGGLIEALVFYAIPEGWDIRRAWTKNTKDYYDEEMMTPNDVTDWLNAKIKKCSKATHTWQHHYESTPVQGQHIVACWKLTHNL